jgi:hypothetical protein
VAGHLEQLSLGDVRGVDELVARLLVAAPAVVLQLLADHAALGVEDGQPRADLVREREQIELRAEPAVVAPLGFGDPVQVRVESLLALPRGAVHALELRVLLAAPPVRGGGAHQLEGRDEPGGGDVRTTAEVAPHHVPGVRVQVVVRGELTGGVDLHDLPVRFHGVGLRGAAALEVDQLQLVRLVRQLLAGLVQRVVPAAGEPLPGLDDLLHRRLELAEVVRGERLRDIEVVVEAVVHRGADAELGLGVQLLDGLGEHVRCRVPDDAAPGLGVGSDRLDLGVGLRGPRQVAQGTTGVADHDDGLAAGGRQPRLPHGGARRGPGGHPDGSGPRPPR